MPEEKIRESLFFIVGSLVLNIWIINLGFTERIYTLVSAALNLTSLSCKTKQKKGRRRKKISDRLNFMSCTVMLSSHDLFIWPVVEFKTLAHTFKCRCNTHCLQVVQVSYMKLHQQIFSQRRWRYQKWSSSAYLLWIDVTFASLPHFFPQNRKCLNSSPLWRIFNLLIFNEWVSRIKKNNQFTLNILHRYSRYRWRR